MGWRGDRGRGGGAGRRVDIFYQGFWTDGLLKERVGHNRDQGIFDQD